MLWLHTNEIKLLVKNDNPIVVCLIAKIGGAYQLADEKWEKMAGDAYSSRYINAYTVRVNRNFDKFSIPTLTKYFS